MTHPAAAPPYIHTKSATKREKDPVYWTLEPFRSSLSAVSSLKQQIDPEERVQSRMRESTYWASKTQRAAPSKAMMAHTRGIHIKREWRGGRHVATERWRRAFESERVGSSVRTAIHDGAMRGA